MKNNCESCKKYFEYDMLYSKNKRRFCDNCRRLKKEMYSYNNIHIKSFKSIEQIEMERISKERLEMKIVFSWDEVSVYV